MHKYTEGLKPESIDNLEIDDFLHLNTAIVNQTSPGVGPDSYWEAYKQAF